MVRRVGVITEWFPPSCADTPRIGFISSRPGVPVFLIYSLEPPTPVPQWNERGGIRTRCGFLLTWHNTFCVDQETPLDPTVHSFRLPNYPDLTTIFYFFADHCDPALATWTSPDFTFTYGVSPAEVAHVQAFKDTAQGAPPFFPVGIVYQQETCDGHTPHDPNSARFWVRATGTYLFRWEIRHSTGGSGGIFTYQIRNFDTQQVYDSIDGGALPPHTEGVGAHPPALFT